MSRRISGPALLALFVSACSDGAPPVAPTPPSLPPPIVDASPLTGVVTQEESGSPLSGATVRIVDGPNQGFTTVTSQSGEYRFQFLRSGNMNLSALAAGHVERRLGVHVAGPTTLNITLPLRTFLPLRGIVTLAATGERLAGVAIQFVGDGPNRGKSTISGADGVYRFTDLQGGTSTFDAIGRGFEALRHSVVVNGTNVLDFAMRHLPRAPLTGVVRATSTGAPIAGATITGQGGMADSFHNEGRTTTSNSNGEYRFEDLYVSNTNFTVTAQGYVRSGGGVFVDGTNTLDFTMQPAAGTRTER